MTPAFFFSSRRRHTRWPRDWSSDVCSPISAGRAEVPVAEKTPGSDPGGHGRCRRGRPLGKRRIHLSQEAAARNRPARARSEERREGKRVSRGGGGAGEWNERRGGERSTRGT